MLASDGVGSGGVSSGGVACSEPGLARLPGTPWSIRAAAGPAGRAALELYDAGALVDVMVAWSIAPRALRGARSAIWAGQPCAVAWGCLPADPADFAVSFRQKLSGRRRARLGERAADITILPGGFWIGRAAGRFDQVTVAYRGIRDRYRLRSARRR